MTHDFTPLPDSLRLAAIVDGSDDAIISKDTNGVITSWNRAAERMFGYSSEEAVGRSIRMIIPQHLQSEEDMVLGRIRRGERLEHFETTRCRRNGELFQVELTVSPIRDASGRIIGASKIARDITDRKRAEAALAAARTEQAELRRRLSTIIAASSSLLLSPRLEDVSVAIVSAARDIVQADAYALWRVEAGAWRVAASFGLSPAFTQITHPVDSAAELTHEPRVIDEVEAEWLGARRDAYALEGIRSVLVIPLEGGVEVSASVAFYYRERHAFTEVERRSAEEFGTLASAVMNTAQMYESQRRSRYEADFIAEATSLLAAAREVNEAIARLSHRVVPQLADWCGCYLLHDTALDTVSIAAAAPHGASAVELFEREDEEGSAFSVEQVIRSGAPLLLGDWARDASEDTLRSEQRQQAAHALGVRSVVAVPLVAHGRVLGALTLGTGASGRRFTSEDLRFAQELAYRVALSIDNSLSFQEARAANRLKDEFLANLSHELRTPLNAIAGYARMLRDGTLPADRRDRAYEVLDNNAAALTQIVEDVLDISRIVTGKIRLQVEPVALRSVIAKSVDTVRTAADAKSIRIAVSDDGEAVVSGDPDRLQQVFWNLLSNAVKFTPNRGSIDVRLQVAEDVCEVAVRDTGVGIDPDVLPHVFERFRQGDSRFSREHGGLGLGLAIASQIVELHGGTIAAESEGPGRGATFRVSLPLISSGLPSPADRLMLS